MLLAHIMLVYHLFSEAVGEEFDIPFCPIFEVQMELCLSFGHFCEKITVLAEKRIRSTLYNFPIFVAEWRLANPNLRGKR